MEKRFLSLAVCVSMAAGTAAFAQNSGKGYLVQFPGPEEQGARFLAYTADATPLIADVDALGPNNSTQLIAKPDGSKFYILGDGPIQQIDANLSTFQTLNGISGTPRIAKITPDGKQLLVAADLFYVVNTDNDTIASTGAGINSGTVTGIAISRDSKKAWILVESGFSGSVITIDLVKYERIGDPLSLPFRGRGIFLSPQNFLYVTFSNQIRRYDPDTLTLVDNGIIDVLATPGPLNFTPDGTAAYMVNNDPFVGGRALLRLDIATSTITDWPAFNPNMLPPVFESLLVAGNNRIFGYSRDNTTLYDVTMNPLGATKTALNDLFPADQVLGAAISNELPSARFLFVLINNGNQTNLLRIDLSNNTINAQVLALINSGHFQFVGVPPTTGAASFLQFNNNQTLAHGGVAQSIITQVLDGLGRPVFNLPVTHSVASDSGVELTNPQTVTNADGYVETGVTIPDAPGVYTVTVVAGAATTSYTFTVPEQGGGTPGGPQRVSIAGGDGQLIQQFYATPIWQPLTVLVVDTNGEPQAGVPVTFSVVDGSGNLTSPTTTTNDKGMAATDFFAGSIPFGIAFSPNTVRATTPVGTADFKVTAFRLNNDATGQPEVYVLKPESQSLEIGQGDVIESGIQASIHSSLFPQIGTPIPDVGIRIADRFDITMPGPASCQGLSRSDNNGVASCNVLAGCLLGRRPGLIVVGEYRTFDVIFNIGPGHATSLNILAGDNQSGKSDDLLSPLAINVTDGCGTAVPGVPVTWTVIQGSATLSSVQTTSDVGGRASARLTLGAVPGPVQVKVSIPNAAPVTFNFSNNAVVSGLFLQSGSGQSVLANQAFPNPVVFIVRDGNNAPLQGITMNFSVSGNASINPTQATTNAQGTAQTSVVAGNAPGTITITATYGTFTAVATLQVRPPGPQITSTSFFNAASYALGLTPCGLVTVIGNGIKTTPGTSTGGSLFGPLSYTVDGVSITVNNIPAPIYSVINSNGQQQATFQAPCELQPGSATVQMTVNGTTTTVTGVAVLAAQPGVFTYTGSNGKAYGDVVSRKDGAYVMPSNPAHRGEVYYLLLTGLGQVTPATSTDAAGTGQNVNLRVVVGINNVGVPVISAQYLAGGIGVYIVDFKIPEDAATGTDQPLAVAVIVNGQTVFGNSVFLPGVI